MKMDPFIEAEEAAGHSVKRCCELFWAPAPPTTSAAGPPLGTRIERRRADREDHRHPQRLQGHLRLAQGASRALQAEHLLRTAPGPSADAPGQTRGSLQEALAKETVPDPAAERAKDLIQRHFGLCTELDRRYVGYTT